MSSVNERAWIARIKKSGDTEVTIPLCTALTVVGSVIAVDRDLARSIRLKVQTEEEDGVLIDIPAGDSIKGAGKELLAKLRERGVLMTDEGMKFIVDLIRENQPPNAIKQYSKPGFHGRVFVAPSGEALNSNYPVELIPSMRQKGESYSGSLDGWRDAIRQTFPHFHFSMAVCLGFVGPLIDLLKWDTVTVYLSGATSHGKSTSQRLGASVWGDTKVAKGQLISAKATPNALEIELAKASGSYLALDEGVHLDGAQTKEIIFMGHSGSGKTRMSQHGDAKPNRVWNTCVTISDELGLVQKLRRDNQSIPGGLTVRAIDVSYDDVEKLSPAVMAEIERAYDNTGHAGPVFIRQLTSMGYVDAPSRLADEIHQIAGELAGPEASSQQRRAALIPALVKKAGLIAKVAGLFPAEADVDVMARDLWERARASDLAPVSNDARALDALRESIVSRKGVDIVEVGADPHRQAKGWHLPASGKSEEAYAILVSAAPELAGGIMTSKALGKALNEADWLIPHSGKGNARDYVGGIGRVSCYVIRAAKIDS